MAIAINKNPTAGWQWGSLKPVIQSEPNRRAAQQQQRARKQQVQMTIHDNNLAGARGDVNPLFRVWLACAPPDKVCRAGSTGCPKPTQLPGADGVPFAPDGH